MAIINAADYDHIDIVNGADTNRHMLKDAQARVEVADLKSAVMAATGNERIEYTVANGYYSTSTVGATVTSPTANDNFQAAMISCSPGDVFTVSGTGGGQPRVWAFLDSDHKVTRFETRNVPIENAVITAGPGETYLVLNNHKVNNPGAVSYYGELLVKRFNAEVANTSERFADDRYMLNSVADDYTIVKQDYYSASMPTTANDGILFEYIPVNCGLIHVDFDSIGSTVAATVITVKIVEYNGSKGVVTRTVISASSGIVLRADTRYITIALNNAASSAAGTKWVKGLTVYYGDYKYVLTNNALKRDNKNQPYMYRDKIPTQYIDPPETFTSLDDDAYLASKLNGLDTSLGSFVFYTDTHWEYNMQHSIPLAQYIRYRTGASKVLFGGDVLGLSDTKYAAKKVMCDFAYPNYDAFGDDFLPIMGNHDINMANCDAAHGYDTAAQALHYLPYSAVRETLFAETPNYTKFYNPVEKINAATADTAQRKELADYFKMTYYVDDTSSRTRFVVVNTGNPTYGTAYDIFGVAAQNELLLTMDFVADAIRTTPSGYNLVIAGHWFARTDENDQARLYTITGCYARMCYALKNKTTATVTRTATGTAALDNWYAMGDHVYDFSTGNDINKVLFIFGHVHYDQVFVCTATQTSTSVAFWNGTDSFDEKAGVFPFVSTICDAYAATHPGTTMTPNTTTDQALDLITFKPTSIQYTRFGVGTDRELPIIP